MQEHQHGEERPPSGRGDGLRADEERVRPHSEEWARFLRVCCAGCRAAADRAAGSV